MDTIVFIVVLSVLIFVHELGHFLFAKLFNIRVDEFGFGYPPKILKIFNWRGTDFTINWIPFGGFVKIFGESDDGSELTSAEKEVSLVHKPRWQQILVMLGGIIFNIIFAWVLFVGVYMSGVTASVQTAPDSYDFDETKLIVTNIIPDSPASTSDLMLGDEILEYLNDEVQVTVTTQGIEDIAGFVQDTAELDQAIQFVVSREGVLDVVSLIPQEGLVDGRYGVGIGVDRVGEMSLPFGQALVYSAKNTWGFMKLMTIGFIDLISGQISFDNVSGPVGIAGQVGQARDIGISYLITFTALLSLNLAILNLVPFPALDGGRILILLIESVIRRRLKPSIINIINTVGFFALIALMVAVTVKDVINLF